MNLYGETCMWDRLSNHNRKLFVNSSESYLREVSNRIHQVSILNQVILSLLIKPLTTLIRPFCKSYIKSLGRSLFIFSSHKSADNFNKSLSFVYPIFLFLYIYTKINFNLFQRGLQIAITWLRNLVINVNGLSSAQITIMWCQGTRSVTFWYGWRHFTGPKASLSRLS